jgi:hypothetical protein
MQRSWAPAPSPFVSLALPDSEKPATDSLKYGTALIDTVLHEMHVLSLVLSANNFNSNSFLHHYCQ